MDSSPDTSLSILTTLQAKGLRVESRQGEWNYSFIQIVQTGSEANPASWSMGKTVLPRGQSDRGLKLIIQHLGPNLRINGAIRPPSLHGFMASTGTTTLLLRMWIMAPNLSQGKTEGKDFQQAVLVRRNITAKHC